MGFACTQPILRRRRLPQQPSRREVRLDERHRAAEQEALRQLDSSPTTSTAEHRPPANVRGLPVSSRCCAAPDSRPLIWINMPVERFRKWVEVPSFSLLNAKGHDLFIGRNGSPDAGNLTLQEQCRDENFQGSLSVPVLPGNIGYDGKGQLTRF